MTELDLLKTRDCTLVQVYLPPDWAAKIRAAAALQGKGAGRWIAEAIAPRLEGMRVSVTDQSTPQRLTKKEQRAPRVQ